jgi:hypothetical protein
MVDDWIKNNSLNSEMLVTNILGISKKLNGSGFLPERQNFLV